MKDRLPTRLLRGVLSIVMLVFCAFAAGCGSSGGPDTAAFEPAPQPVALSPRRDGAPTVSMAVDEAELRKAIERHRITKKRRESPVEFAGADLNSDGKGEAVVLFTGDDWCSPTGCSLVVFAPSEFGYRTISHTVSAKGPLAVGPGSNAGWRDLLVRTGGGAAPVRTVRLQFSGGGYPVNALLQPEPTPDVVAQGEMLIQGGQGATASAATQPPR
jgi:hypothetical protein